MKFYLAGRYSRRNDLDTHAGDLIEFGHEITSRWLGGTHELTTEMSDHSSEWHQKWAREDLADIDECQALIAFTESEPAPRGGRHVEFGYALAKGKHLIVIGPVENIFMSLPNVLQFNTWSQFLFVLDVVDSLRPKQ